MVRLKTGLDLNVELASPSDFIPPLPGWRERSRFIEHNGQLSFFHYDFYAQALSKIERGHSRDRTDVREMLTRGLIQPDELLRLFEAIEGELFRYPALHAAAFRGKLMHS